MRKALRSLENIFFFLAVAALLCGSVTARLLHAHRHFANPRVEYGTAHLAAALFASALFAAAVALLRARLFASQRLQSRSTLFYLCAIAAAFSCFWLPVVLQGGFVHDDWLLLAAASVHKIIYLHPQYSWHALDSVDGNFRPLGTVLYIGFLYRFAGLHPLPYLAGCFAVNLLSSLVAFAIVRELGYSRLAAAAASLLYISRGIAYIPNAWVAALGDALVILLCSLVVLCTLRANRQTPLRASLYHAIAWALFLIATLAKQSAFAIPLIVALLLLLRPGNVPPRPLFHRVRAAALALFVYGGTATVIFLHARALFGSRTPYPLSLTLQSVTGLLNYAAWYFITLDLPPHNPLANALPRVAGLVVVLALAYLVWRFPRALGERPKDTLFLLLSALASLSLFLLLPTRSAAYYGSMAAFWFSLALAIALTRFAASAGPAPRIACFVFCVLIALGFLDIRLKQTGLIPSGGYIWGTYGSDLQAAEYTRMAALLAAAPRTLVLVDTPDNEYAAMALIADPGLSRILIYDSAHAGYQVNDLDGYRPQDTLASLSDPQSFHWTLPLAPGTSGPLDRVLWIGLRNGVLTPMPAPVSSLQF